MLSKKRNNLYKKIPVRKIHTGIFVYQINLNQSIVRYCTNASIASYEANPSRE